MKEIMSCVVDTEFKLNEAHRALSKLTNNMEDEYRDKISLSDFTKLISSNELKEIMNHIHMINDVSCKLLEALKA